MLLLDHIFQAMRTLSSNKLRSFLSILGLVIGVMSVTVLVSLVEGLQNQITSELNDVSRNTVTLVAGSEFNPFNPVRSQEFPGFTETEIAYLQEAMPFVDGIEAGSAIQEPVYYRGAEINVEQYAAVTVGMDKIESIDIVDGRWINDDDVANYRNVVVVSSNFIDQIFDGERAVGKELVIADQHFTIIGVTEAATVGFFSPLVMYMPITTGQLKILGDPFYQFLVLKVNRGYDLKEALQLTQYLMLKRLGDEHVDDAQFQALSTETFIEQFNTITALLQLGLGGVGAIALLVGGIGVMNIMLVSVTERTREIGIRKAIGAKDRDIMIQFLTESIILGLFGCFLGVAVSRGIILLLQQFGIPSVMNGDTITVAVVFSLSVGVIFGVGPARKAAKMKPIDALRFE